MTNKINSFEKTPLAEHFLELRRRFMWGYIGWIVTTIVVWLTWSEVGVPFLNFIYRPLLESQDSSSIFEMDKWAFGICLGFYWGLGFLVIQLFLFAWSALESHERRWSIFLLIVICVFYYGFTPILIRTFTTIFYNILNLFIIDTDNNQSNLLLLLFNKSFIILSERLLFILFVRKKAYKRVADYLVPREVPTELSSRSLSIFEFGYLLSIYSILTVFVYFAPLWVVIVVVFYIPFTLIILLNTSANVFKMFILRPVVALFSKIKSLAKKARKQSFYRLKINTYVETTRVQIVCSQDYLGDIWHWRDDLHIKLSKKLDHPSDEILWNELFQEMYDNQIQLNADITAPVGDLIHWLNEELGYPEFPPPRFVNWRIIGTDTWETFHYPHYGHDIIKNQLINPWTAVPLKPEMSLQEQGVKNDDVLVFIPYHPIARGLACQLYPVPSIEYLIDKILNMYVENENALDVKCRYVLGVLLYTEEDEELAIYVRKHFASLSKMTGDTLRLFAIEKPPEHHRQIADYWRTKLQENLFVVWSAMGWLMTKPYDKSQAYEIGCRLGVYPDQFPCIVLFDNLENPQKIIFPISSVSTKFFRNIFTGIIQATQQAEATSDNPLDTVRERYQMIIDRLQATASAPDRIQYTFHGNTVFINKPSGVTTIKDFQKGNSL